MKKVINKPEIYFSMDLCDCSGFFWGLFSLPRWFQTQGHQKHLLPDNGQILYKLMNDEQMTTYTHEQANTLNIQ